LDPQQPFIDSMFGLDRVSEQTLKSFVPQPF